MFKRNRRPTAPGEILRADYMKPRGISVSGMADAVGVSRKHMSNVVNGKVRIEWELAGKIAAVLGTTPRIWLNLQANVDAWDAENALGDWKPLRTYPAPAEDGAHGA